ncbi:MAG: hypothetical protein AAGU74_07835 [Bacillota bacterium]
MQKFIPREKLAKSARKALDAKKRVTWGALRPVTRKAERQDAYNRKKARRQTEEDPDAGLFIAL